MTAKPPYPYAILTYRNPPWAQSSHFRRRVNFKNVDHARNYCRKIIGQVNSRRIDPIVKITVWLSEDEPYIWNKGKGWQR